MTVDLRSVADGAAPSSAAPGPVVSSVAIVTLGCGRNEVDSDQLAGLFHREGVPVLDDPAEADVVLVNTCTFIAPAKQESIDTILEACDLKGEDGVARAVVVVGCMAERYPQELADAIPEADAIVGFDGYARLPELVADVVAGRTVDRVIGTSTTAAPTADTATAPGAVTGARRGLPLLPISPVTPGTTRAPGDADLDAASAQPAGEASGAGDAVVAPALVLGLAAGELPPEAPRTVARHLSGQDVLDRVPASGPRFPVRRHDGRPWAYLKLASGCDRLCTFCAIPSFRGRFRSRPLDELVAEARWLVEQGARELVLVSENTTSWGKDLDGGRDTQAAMVTTLAEVDGLERLRLMYLQPAELTVALVETIAGHPKVASYFDLSLQHVSGPVVRRMARSGDHERFGALVERIRGLDPDAVFRSNFILGFPGETDHDVEVLESFLVDHRLDWVGLFAYSAEDGTPAATMPDQVDPAEAAERVERLASVQERVADAAARRFVGRDLAVTVEDVVTDDAGAVELVAGRSFREAPDTDGEVQLVTADGTPAEVPVGRTVTAQVVDAIGVDLVAEVTRAYAGADPAARRVGRP